MSAKQINKPIDCLNFLFCLILFDQNKINIFTKNKNNKEKSAVYICSILFLYKFQWIFVVLKISPHKKKNLHNRF